MKKILIPAIALLVVVAGIQTYAHINLQSPLNSVVEADARNKGIKASASYSNWFPGSRIVFNLTEVSGSNSPADVFRVFLLYAEKQKNKSFTRVILAHKGKQKFMIEGPYFKKLGQEHGSQKPVYTIRTFPEHVFDLSGKQAFANWTGGVLGVVNKQMEDFNEFNKQWFINDL
jgi:hypothetical protein